MYLEPPGRERTLGSLAENLDRCGHGFDLVRVIRESDRSDLAGHIRV